MNFVFIILRKRVPFVTAHAVIPTSNHPVERTSRRFRKVGVKKNTSWLWTCGVWTVHVRVRVEQALDTSMRGPGFSWNEHKTDDTSGEKHEREYI